MGRTTVQVDTETADRLHERKARGESYDDVIRRLLGDEGDVEDDTGRTPDARTDDLTPLSGRSDDGADVVVPPTVPDRIDHADARAAIAAVLNELADGPAGRREIVESVAPEHPLGYEQPTAERGSWWRKVARPGLEENGAVYENGVGWTLKAEA